MYCRMCGKQVPSGSKFCPSCGARQDAEVPPQTYQPPQVPVQAPQQAAPQTPTQAPPQTTPQAPTQTPPQTYQQAPQQVPPQAYQQPPQQAYQPPQAPVQAPQQAAPQAYQSAPAPQAAPKKKSPLIPIVVVILVIAAAAAAFFAVKAQNEKKEKEQKQDSITSFIDEDLVELEKLKDQVVDSFEYVSRENIEEIGNTLKLSSKLVGAATDISTSLAKSDPELGMVSNTYLGFSMKCLNATKKFKSAYEEYYLKGYNEEFLSELKDVLALLEEADDLYSQFQKELKGLADERDVSYKKNSQVLFEDIIAEYRAVI